MQSYIYIDYENMSNIKELPKLENGKYFVFLGATQKSKLSYPSGTRVRIIKIENIGKNALDYKLKEFMQNRTNVQNTMHFIISKDKGYDTCINEINKKKTMQNCIQERGVEFFTIDKYFIQIPHHRETHYENKINNRNHNSNSYIVANKLCNNGQSSLKT